MRTRDEVTAEKLRGGFYSPDPLVDLCLDRIASLTRGRGVDRDVCRTGVDDTTTAAHQRVAGALAESEDASAAERHRRLKRRRSLGA